MMAEEDHEEVHLTKANAGGHWEIRLNGQNRDIV